MKCTALRHTSLSVCVAKPRKSSKGEHSYMAKGSGLKVEACFGTVQMTSVTQAESSVSGRDAMTADFECRIKI